MTNKLKITYTNGTEWILEFDKYEHPLYKFQVEKSYKSMTDEVVKVEWI